jgi:sugar phosphate isomerase/epimerase
MHQKSLNSNLSPIEVINFCAKHGFSGVGLTYGELSAENKQKIHTACIQNGVTITSLAPSSIQNFGTSQQNNHLISTYTNMINEAADIGARGVVFIAGGLNDCSETITKKRETVAEILAHLRPILESRNIRLGIEPLHPVFASDRSIICDLVHARDLADELGDFFGVVIDTYHVWWQRSICDVIRSIPSHKIIDFHVNDWTIEAQDRLWGRAMMGDGVIDLVSLSQAVLDTGYTEFIEVEILSKQLSMMSPEDFLSLSYQRLGQLISSLN